MASAPSSDNSHISEHPNVTYDFQHFQTCLFLYLIVLLIIALLVQIFERLHNWLQLEAVAQLDIELGQIANHHPSSDDNIDWSHEHATSNNPDWSHEHAALNNPLVSEIVNGFMAYLAERQQVSGPSQEFLEQASPCVEYKSLGKTTEDECVICLSGLEDEEMCRVFPVCNHVFHYKCIDNWLRDHLTCPICRGCIIDSSMAL